MESGPDLMKKKNHQGGMAMKIDWISLPLGLALAILICFQALAFVQDGRVTADGQPVSPTNPAITPSRVTRDHFAATDGFIRMPDGRDIYIFGFTNVSSLVKFNNHSTSLAIQKKGQADFTAPTIEMREGMHHYQSLSTLGMWMRPDLFDPHTIHFHGYPHASPLFDGEPMASLKVNQGADFTYFYQLNDPGTYMFHCHNEATEHMEMGMLGNLIVRPRQDEFITLNPTLAPQWPPASGKTYSRFVYDDCDNLPADVTAPPAAGFTLTGSVCGSTGFDTETLVQFEDIDPGFHDNDSFAQPLCFACFKARYFTLNGRGYPDTADINPPPNNAGAYGGPANPLINYPAQKINSLVSIGTTQQTAVIRLHNLSIQEFVTIEIPGLPVQVIGKDAKFLRRPNGKDLRYYTNSVLIGPGESAELRIDKNDPNYPPVTPGTYYMYSRMLDQLTSDQMDRSGAMTEIRIQ
jgi:FtsP/CotA-like multicopper oxidase with cupredoxin domain